MIKMYNGPLNLTVMDKATKRAYKSWKDQGQRCQNPNDVGWKNWGARGIKRVYGSREFIGWYLEQYEKQTLWKRPHVDRINSNGNYEFGNIQLIESSENTKKRNLEHGNPTPSHKIIAKNLATNDILAIESIREASRLLGIDRKGIKNFLEGKIKRKPSHGFEFYYDNDT